MNIRHGMIDGISYALMSPLILIIAAPVMICGIAEIIIKKIDPEYFNR